MQYVIRIGRSLVTLALAVGAITGRVKARSGCAPGDPDKDLRMRPEDNEARSK